MQKIAFDVETLPISAQHPVPPLVCVSYATGDEAAILTLQDNPGDWFKRVLESGAHLIGHNVAFDLSVMIEEYPDTTPLVFKALDEDRIHDTMLRERLLMLCINGNLKVFYQKGRNRKIGYKLSDLEKLYLGIDRSKQKNNPDSVRFNYEKVLGLAVDEWPQEYIKYAIEDSMNCLRIFNAQQIKAESVEQGNPFAVDTFRSRAAFALRLLEVVGERVDPERVREVTAHYQEAYNDPKLTEPLAAIGLLKPGTPALPYANGAKNHKPDCCHHKDHPDYKAGRPQRCDCPPKMKKGQPDKMPTSKLNQYIWELAADGKVEAWPAPKVLIKGARSRLSGRKFKQEFIQSTKTSGGTAILPKDLTLKSDEEWISNFADKDPILKKWATRKALRKIVTDYLPKLYLDEEMTTPAPVIRGSYSALVLTGRSSCRASDLYPSRNSQNVDPRVRPCTIPREGNVIVSTDFSGMELGTLAQKCFNLFHESVLMEKINNGDDVHAYLASQIAYALDTGFKKAMDDRGWSTSPQKIFEAFRKCKNSTLSCEIKAPETAACYRTQYLADHDEEFEGTVTWGDFFKYYRKLAKPTGLGFPGGLGPATMVVYAKGTYKVDITEQMAVKLRNIWLNTYPEMDKYLGWIKNCCRDKFTPSETVVVDGKKRMKMYFAYTTPRGMVRSRCSFCEAANGAGLQAIAAEGALDALYQAQKLCWLAPTDGLFNGCFPINFVHDEIIWESPDDSKVGTRIKYMDHVMVNSMQKITPDVIARTESSVMRRWYKEAEPVYNVAGQIIPWEPKE